MKIQIFSSRYKPYYEDIKEIPISVNLNDGESVCIKYEPYCLQVGKQDRPFGKWSNKMCCEECN